MPAAKTPLVYSCSGCSNVAQLANELALHLDSEGVAEMSCIAGVGGHVRSLVKKAKSGRAILALDGCPLACVKQSLAQHRVEPTWHIELTQMGLKKQKGESCGAREREYVVAKIRRLLNVVEVEVP